MTGSGTRPTRPGRPNVFEVDLRAIASNVEVIRRRVGAAWFCAALKADAYGFGLLEVAGAVVEAGVDALAVGDVGEGVRLRQAGIRAPVLVYAGTPLDRESTVVCQEHGLIATVHDDSSLKACLSRGGGLLEVFLEVDAGLQRLGFARREVPSAAARLAADPGIRLTGVYTHLHMPDDPERAATALPAQFSRFLEAANGVPSGACRMAASSRVLARFSSMVLDAVDPGRALYGLPWNGDEAFQEQLRPAFAGLRSSLLQVKLAGEGPYVLPGRRLGVIPIGRRDGLPLLTCGEVLVRGRRVALVGPPSLEHSRVDLDAVPDAEAGDDVVIIGRQVADEITVEEVLAARPALAPTAVGLEVRPAVERRFLR